MISFNQLTGITQDKNGIMWFASNIGLFSYNGYEMVSYKNNPLDPNSIAGDILRAVCADNDGNIWIAVQGEGIDMFDPVTGIFTHFRHDPDDPESLTSEWVNVMLVDRDGILWIGSGIGLDRYDIRTEKFINYENIPDDSTSLSYNEVVAIYEDHNGTLWIGTGSVYGADQNKVEAGGLNRMDKKTGTFKRFMHDPANTNSLINNKVSAIYEDSNGTLWIGTAGDGLHTMDKSTGIITRHTYDPNDPEKLSRPPVSNINPENDHITFIVEDMNRAIWIGTSNAGLIYYNTGTKKGTHFESEDGNSGSFTDNTTWAGYISSDGVLWISTISGTLYRINPEQSDNPAYRSSQLGYLFLH